MKTTKSTGVTTARGIFFIVLLAVLLVVLFGKSFLPGYVHFSNDGPLGAQKTLHFPGAFTGAWGDMNDIGSSGGAFPPSLTALIRKS